MGVILMAIFWAFDYRKFAVFVFRPGAETYPLPFRKPGGGGDVIRLSGHRTGRIAAYS